MDESPEALRADAQPWAGRLRFRLVHLIYALTLLSTALAALGPGGLVAGLLVLAFWVVVFASRSRPRALAVACLMVLFCFCLLGLLLPSVSSARAAAMRMSCHNNLKQLSLALHLYYDDYKSFPPPFLADKQGRPMHSWRVLILPYVDEPQLYQAYRFDEPWDGPNNRLLATRRPRVFACPNHASDRHDPACTSYLAIVDARAAWDAEGVRRFVDFPDGTNHTIQLIEGNADIPWTQPTDATLEEALALLASDAGANSVAHVYEDYFYIRGRTRTVALADGSVQSLPLPLDRELARQLLQRDDGAPESWDAPAARKAARNRKQLKLGNVARLSAFLLLVLLPLPWVWIGQRRQGRVRGAGEAPREG